MSLSRAAAHCAPQGREERHGLLRGREQRRIEGEIGSVEVIEDENGRRESESLRDPRRE
jgi:hypothetical protein